MSVADGIVVIGGGQAASTLVLRLRELGFEGSITLIGEEPVPPYQRPPLSKAYLLGEMDLDSLFLRPLSFYADKDITLKLGKAVSAIDPVARTVTLGDEVIGYDKLALATGSVPIRLPAGLGGDLLGIHVVRGLHDIDGLEPEIAEGRSVLIVGGGYIGLEAAAVCAKKGLKVTLVEAAPRILSRVAARETSDYFRALHQSHGVELIEGVGLERFTGDKPVEGAILSDGREISCDFAIVGIGIRPATELAEAAGLAIENGIKTDDAARTSDPHIWAAGDCASFPHQGEQIRLESVGNAIDQAKVVAESMLGREVSYKAKPWFWSDQYDVKLQIAGLNHGYDRIVSRDSGDGIASFWYYQGDKLLAIDAMNDPRAYMVGKRLIEAGMTANPAIVTDPNADLKQLMKRR